MRSRKEGLHLKAVANDVLCPACCCCCNLQEHALVHGSRVNVPVVDRNQLRNNQAALDN